MNTYEVTYQAISPSFRNSEIEVPAAQAAEIRAELTKALKAREPMVYGRDWYYDSVAVKDTMLVEGDHYSVSNNGTAHFYEGQNTTTPSASVLNVIHVRKLAKDEPLPLHLIAQAGTVPADLMKSVVEDADKKLTWVSAPQDFRHLLDALYAKPAWARLISQVSVAKGSERIEIRAVYPRQAPDSHSER
jgi:hypothetical protein